MLRCGMMFACATFVTLRDDMSSGMSVRRGQEAMASFGALSFSMRFRGVNRSKLRHIIRTSSSLSTIHLRVTRRSGAGLFPIARSR